MNMKTPAVIDALGALAHEHRLAVYRLLVERGPEGFAAGVIGERVGLAPSSLTFHLQSLQRAGLITRRRDSRQLIYCADFTAMNELVGYLTENCCGNSGNNGNSSSAQCSPACAPIRRAKSTKRTAKVA